MKLIIAMILLSFFSLPTFACVDLSGKYGDFIASIELKQVGCEKIIQSNSTWDTSTSLKTEYILDGKEYVDPKFKSFNGSYAFQKAEIDLEKMVVTFRRGNPKVKGNTFLKIFSKDPSGRLVIQSYEVKGENKVLKDKWVLKKKK